MHEKITHGFLQPDNTNDAAVIDINWVRRAFMLDSRLLEQLEKNRLQKKFVSMSNFLSMASFAHSWRVTHSFKKNVGRTTKEHLFITKFELERFIHGLKSTQDGNAGNHKESKRVQKEIKINNILYDKDLNALPTSPANDLNEDHLQMNDRRNALTDIIELAIDKAAPNTSTSRIWKVLIDMAKETKPASPLLGYEKGEIVYENGERSSNLDYRSFGGRVRRALKRREMRKGLRNFV